MSNKRKTYLLSVPTKDGKDVILYSKMRVQVLDDPTGLSKDFDTILDMGARFNVEVTKDELPFMPERKDELPFIPERVVLNDK